MLVAVWVRQIVLVDADADSSRCSTMSAERCRSIARRGARRGVIGLRNPLDPTRRIRAVLFDLDGTLYRQRRCVADGARAADAAVDRAASTAPQRWRALAAYRKAQERLRSTDTRRLGGRGATRRPRRAARACRSKKSSALVDEWMLERPLKYLRAVPRDGARPAARRSSSARACGSACCPTIPPSRSCEPLAARPLLAGALLDATRKSRRSSRIRAGFCARAERGGCRRATC